MRQRSGRKRSRTLADRPVGRKFAPPRGGIPRFMPDLVAGGGENVQEWNARLRTLHTAGAVESARSRCIRAVDPWPSRTFPVFAAPQEGAVRALPVAFLVDGRGVVLLVEIMWRQAGEARNESDAEHLARHGVTRDEFEEALWSARRWRRVPGRRGRHRAVGLTRRGRALMILVEPWRDAKDGLWSPVTARDATRRERRRYRCET